MSNAAIIQALVFYAFALVTIVAALFVIMSRNPVHAVLFLMLAFFSSAGLFVLLGAEFLAMILVIVYVGAVAVLFLFVVMMLNIDFEKLRSKLAEHLPVGMLVGLVLLIELIMVLKMRAVALAGPPGVPSPLAASASSNTATMGRALYTDYIYAFQGAGLILLVAMIGAIVLTHRSRPGVKKQKIADQVARTAKTTIEVVKVRPGQGI